MSKLSFLSARAFDAGLAGLAAVSAGFVAFAMPESLFSGLVETSRLPEFVPAAEPPLGETARLAAAGAASLLTFPAVWGLMALLGRVPASRMPQADPQSEAEAEAPKLRRADAHPDAPARRPLLARDLGEPLDLDEFPEASDDEEAHRAEAEAEAEADTYADARPLPAFLVPQALEAEPLARAESQWEEPEARWAPPEPQPVEADWQPEPEPEPETAAWAEPETAAWAEPETPAWAEPEPAAWAEPETGPEIRPISELAAQLPEAGEESDQSLSQLVNRIEFGLSRKRQALPAAPDSAPTEESSTEQEKVGHRLRSAINDLQKIASTGG